MGNAIGKAPKDKIFKKYIEIGLQLGQIDHCRIMYEKYLEWAPANCYAWSKYAELERSLSETDRARAIFDLAIAQPALDMPELLWKMMDMREAVEEASDSQAPKQIESQIQMKLEAWPSSFNEAFMRRDFDNAIAATQRMRYYECGVEEIVKKS